jgi:hypothetical protein
MVAVGASKAGALQLLAADRYLGLRRSVYFAGWRTKRAGGSPEVSDADFAELTMLQARVGLLTDAAGPHKDTAVL